MYKTNSVVDIWRIGHSKIIFECPKYYRKEASSDICATRLQCLRKDRSNILYIVEKVIIREVNPFFDFAVLFGNVRSIYLQVRRSCVARRCYSKTVMKNFGKFKSKHLCRSTVFHKGTGCRCRALLKKRFWLCSANKSTYL